MYLDGNNIKLGENQQEYTDKIVDSVSFDYDHTEKLMMLATIKKIKKNLPDELITDFDMVFGVPLKASGSLKKLSDMRSALSDFMLEHE